jgi:hypothetical protein
MPFPLATLPGGSLQPGFRNIDGSDILALLSGKTSFTGLSLVGLFGESASDSLTAHAGGGQASALVLTSELNRVSTVATSGDSVALPVSFAGLTIIVENAGANPMQVYGAGTDTINGVATATGVSQMASSVVIYTCYTAGAWFANGLGTGYSGSLETQSSANALTAHAGGGQGSALQITTMMARFTTVATIADSAILPVSAAGLVITVMNGATNSMNVFPDTGGAINGGSANAAFAVAGGKTATFFCPAPLVWHALLSA